MLENLAEALSSLPSSPEAVLDFDLDSTAVAIDLSKDNAALQDAWIHGEENLEPFIWQEIAKLGGTAAVGGYGEDRRWYQRNAAFFEGEEARTIHLGVDVWVPVSTPVKTPLDAVVHSFADNNVIGDYGPTVILEHTVAKLKFHTLYGHLNRACLHGLEVGQELAAGSTFAAVGTYEENGSWPVHLHFQLVGDMEGKVGDYPGVAAPSRLDHYFKNCPDPNLILNLDCLR